MAETDSSSPDGKTDGEHEAVLLRIRFHRGDEIFQLLLRGGFAFLVALLALVALFSLVALFVVLSAFPCILRLRRACSKKCEARERERDKQTQKYPFFHVFLLIKMIRIPIISYFLQNCNSIFKKTPRRAAGRTFYEERIYISDRHPRRNEQPLMRSAFPRPPSKRRGIPSSAGRCPPL